MLHLGTVLTGQKIMGRLPSALRYANILQQCGYADGCLRQAPKTRANLVEQNATGHVLEY